MEFLSEEGKQEGPPGLRSIGRAFGGVVGGEEGGEAREVSVEPGFKGKSGGVSQTVTKQDRFHMTNSY